MKLFSNICIALLVIWAMSFAQAPNIVWTKTYGGAGQDDGYCVDQTVDGGFIIVGTTSSFGWSGDNVYLIKTDCLGIMEWQKVYGGSRPEFGSCVRQTMDGGYIIVGSTESFGSGAADVYLVKTDCSGVVEWSRTFGSTGYDYGLWVEQTNDEGYIITGTYWATVGNNKEQVYLIKTDLNGNEQWHRTFGGIQPDFGACVKLAHDGGYIITGATSSSTPDPSDVWLIKTDEWGNEQWNHKYGGLWGQRGTAVELTRDHGYIIVGVHEGSGGAESIILIKTDISGNVGWYKNLGGFRGYDVKQTIDNGYIAVGSIAAGGTYDVYVVKTNSDGNIQWTKDIGGVNGERGTSIQEIRDGAYIITGSTRSFGAGDIDVYFIKLGPEIYDTDDPLALAYNDNRHLVREPNSEKLHLIYTREGKIIHQYSSNGGTSWDLPAIIGDGKLPAITLGSDHLPSIVWTDDIGGIYYRRQIAAGVWGDVYHLWDPWSLGQPALNAPPSIAIVPSAQADSVHILVTLHVTTNGPVNWVADYAFRIDDPMSGMFCYIEGGSGYPQAGAIRYHPSIVKDNQNNLHAVWQRADTICYGVKAPNQTWNNWGPRFGFDGIRSAHPFVETYGDMVYVVWQRKETPGAPEEVYKGWRQRDQPIFYWEPFSLTPNTRSLYPVNANGLFTVFADSPEPPINGFEIYYKTTASELWFNISQTATNSNYPQCAARYFSGQTRLYTAWLDGDRVPYGIFFKRLSYIPMEIPAYYTSINGYVVPSSYLVDRDSFISEWQVPVDIGYETITYQFILEPGYKYKLKAVAYHELSGEWREWIKIDNKLKHLIKYDAYKPETLEFFIPPAFYRDGVIEVVFERIRGAYATAGLIQIYRYEYDEGEGELSGGPMAVEAQAINKIAVRTTPNPFNYGMNLEL